MDAAAAGLLSVHQARGVETSAFRPKRKRRFTSPEMSVPDGTFEVSVTAKRAHALPSTKPRPGMPWLRGEATGLPGLRTANLQRDHRSRLESSSFRAMEDVKTDCPFRERRRGQMAVRPPSAAMTAPVM
jgi:hypothetical protein